MIKTATVISDESREDEVGLYDKVTLLMAGTKEMTVGLVTTFGHDSLSGLISKESPVGKAILGKKVGDTVTVNVNADMSYPVKILAINKGAVENKQI
jgi:transcription elongation factor GreA